mmetsp:Transcript_60666/g.198550  ORF Transcript_60666/g.198550 Transcript_60666/m.198550 type:complete len:217 (+) Transcript_60666:112-762(+)
MSVDAQTKHQCKVCIRRPWDACDQANNPKTAATHGVPASRQKNEFCTRKDLSSPSFSSLRRLLSLLLLFLARHFDPLPLCPPLLLLLVPPQVARQRPAHRPARQPCAQLGDDSRNERQVQDPGQHGHVKHPSQVGDQHVSVRRGPRVLHETKDVGQQDVHVRQDVRQVRVHELQVRSQLLQVRDQEVDVGQEPGQVGLVLFLHFDVVREWLIVPLV